jgi:hypothetical protein
MLHTIFIDPSEKRHTTKSEAETVPSGQSLNGEFILDEPLGRDVQIIFDYSGVDVGVILTSPSGIVYSTTSPECRKDEAFGIYRFVFANTQEVIIKLVNVWCYVQEIPSRPPSLYTNLHHEYDEYGMRYKRYIQSSYNPDDRLAQFSLTHLHKLRWPKTILISFHTIQT